MARRRNWNGASRRRKGRSWSWSDAPTYILFAALGVVALLAVVPKHYWPFQPHPKMVHSRRLTMAEARAINAAIPFVSGKLAPAKPFVFHGTPASREQATRCLATAALYEAGEDRRGQKAVIQVVLNRVRHPAFPKTVCGVVYQGSTLRTGCQFSFTCDGSMQRRPQQAGWAEARGAAKRALGGYVFTPIGTATHYHADWIVPYWSSSLDKIAKVHTHIFYR
jgi:spore germination cell wall hydrolase CwlJ-like protein